MELDGALGSELEIQEGLNTRAKTSLRLQYEAQAQVLRLQMNGLSGVQTKLGLSARKICQLLLVDPSAWSRWMKDEDSVPPHVWRSLQWYFALQDKIPGLNASYFLGRDTAQIEKAIELKISQNFQQKKREEVIEKERLEQRIRILERRLRIFQRLMLGIALFGVAIFILKFSK